MSICLICKNEFRAKIRKERDTAQKYCSRNCYYEAHRAEHVCIVCGNEFVLTKGATRSGGGHTGKYCSKTCYYKSRRGVRIAPHTEFKKGCVPVGGYETRFKNGENHPFWKGGVSGEYDKIKQTVRYKQWRDEVYRRDRWNCQDCGKHCEVGDIAAHHIMSFADHPDLRFEVGNGVTFCRGCHLALHNKLRSGKLCVVAV